MIKKPITIRLSKRPGGETSCHAGTGSEPVRKWKSTSRRAEKVNAKSIMGVMTLGLDNGGGSYRDRKRKRRERSHGRR